LNSVPKSKLRSALSNNKHKTKNNNQQTINNNQRTPNKIKSSKFPNNKTPKP
jgi:hypothetical protein